MTLRKIEDQPPYEELCRHSEHNPPTMIVLPPGTWEHECPSCKRRVQFLVRRLECVTA